jgi:hypothetical protein
LGESKRAFFFIFSSEKEMLSSSRLLSKPVPPVSQTTITVASRRALAIMRGGWKGRTTLSPR